MSSRSASRDVAALPQLLARIADGKYRYSLLRAAAYDLLGINP